MRVTTSVVTCDQCGRTQTPDEQGWIQASMRTYMQYRGYPSSEYLPFEFDFCGPDCLPLVLKDKLFQLELLP